MYPDKRPTLGSKGNSAAPAHGWIGPFGPLAMIGVQRPCVHVAHKQIVVFSGQA
jgi:hypothetical protein